MALASPAFAQGGGASSTGSISGEVKDAQGGVLPGVTVTATSPAQIGALTAVTNEAGIYRFPVRASRRIPLSFELAGFQSERARRHPHHPGLQRPGQRDAERRDAAGDRHGQRRSRRSSTPRATRIQTNYDQQMLASIPNARDMWSLLATTPSVTLNRVDVGGATMGTQTTYFAYGYSGQNRPLIEGINTTEGTSAAGLLPRLRLVRRSVHRRRRQLGRDAEPRRADAVRRQERRQPSVGQRLLRLRERRASRAATSPPIRSRRRPARRIRPDGNRLASYKNLNLGVGGPIIKDAMWGILRVPEPAELGGGAAGGSFLDGTFAIIVSMLVSFTLTPMLSSRFLRLADAASDSKTKEQGFFHVIDQWYERSLTWSLAHPRVILGVSLGVALLTIPFNRAVGRTFIPDEDMGMMTIHADAPQGTSLEGTSALAREVVHELSGQEGVAELQYQAGSGRVNHFHVFVYLKPLDQRKSSQADVMARMREILLQRPGLASIVSGKAPLGGGEGTFAISASLLGPDIDKLYAYSQQLLAKAQQTAQPGGREDRLQQRQPRSARRRRSRARRRSRRPHVHDRRPAPPDGVGRRRDLHLPRRRRSSIR